MTSNKFKSWQRKMGWTNVETAKQLGVSVRLVEDMRGGRRNVTGWTQVTMRLLKEKQK